MTIVFTPTGGSAANLAGSDAAQTDQPAGLTMRGESLVQREAVIRGSMFVKDRGNRRIMGGFTVKKQHADYETALAYIVSHLAGLSGEGALVFTWSGGSETLTSAIVNAEGHAAGATTEWRYEYEGTT